MTAPNTRWPRCGPTICIAASPIWSRTRSGSARRPRSASACRRTPLTIEVEDDGPGISDARKEVMLEPFVRGDDARNMDEAAGFGLGLSIARAIVLAHGGELSLHDRQPHGLIVRIQLPVRQQAPAVGRLSVNGLRPRAARLASARRRTPPPRTGSRRPGNARDRKCGADRLRSSPAPRSARRIGRRGSGLGMSPLWFAMVLFIAAFVMARSPDFARRFILFRGVARIDRLAVASHIRLSGILNPALSCKSSAPRKTFAAAFRHIIAVFPTA